MAKAKQTPTEAAEVAPAVEEAPLEGEAAPAVEQEPAGGADGSFRYLAAHHVRAIDPRGNATDVPPGAEFPCVAWLQPGELQSLLTAGVLIRVE